MYALDGRKIRELIMSRTLSVNEFAKAAGLHPLTVRRILRGNRANIKTVGTIASFFDIDGNELIVEE